MIRQEIASVLFAVTVAVTLVPDAQARPSVSQVASLMSPFEAKDVSVRATSIEAIVGTLNAVGKDIS